MRLVKVAVLLLSCLALGCSLFPSSSNQNPGSNAPVTYPPRSGSGGQAGIGGSEADASGTQADAQVVGPDGTAGSSARSDGGPDAAIMGGPDLGKTPTDADIHNGAQRWIPIQTSYPVTKCTWFSTSYGFCSDAPRSITNSSSLFVDVFQTADGGHNWPRISTIDTGTSASNASVNVYVLSPSEMWFISGSLGVVQAGSIGHSIDGGKNWASLTSTVSAALISAPGDGGVSSVPLWQLASVGERIWLLSEGGNLATSLDNGVNWKKVVPPANFGASSSRSLIATQGNLLLSFPTTNNSLGLLRWNGSNFLSVEGVLPPSSAGDQTGTWWRSSPNLDGVFFVDRGPLPAWGSPFWVYATTDGGATFQQLLGGNLGISSSVVGLSDGLAFAAPGSLAAYVAGVFSDAANSRYLEIHSTNDAGKTWSTLHSEPYQGDHAYISLAVDLNGAVHAMHYTTDNLGSVISYDGHYVLTQ